MEDIISEYIKNVKKFLELYFKILLRDNYNRNIVNPFVDKYISVRYYNKTIFKDDPKLVNRINKELKVIADELIKQDEGNKENVKNTFALFSYVLYLDDSIKTQNKGKILETLFIDKNIKLEYNLEIRAKLVKLVKEYDKMKTGFFALFDQKDFELNFRKLKKDYFDVTIEQHCNISKLYSDYAIEKAFCTGTVLENKYLLLCYYLTFKVLSNVINNDFKKEYNVYLPMSLFKKEKKLNRYLKVISNDIAKDNICLCYTYNDYIINKEIIDKLINNGFKISIQLDSSFKDDFNSLVLFKYVLVQKKYDYYDELVERDDFFKDNIIVI